MGTTERLGLPYPEPSDPPAGAQQIRALAEAMDAVGSRVAEGTFTVAAASNVASGAVMPGTPVTVTFPPGLFTAPPAVLLQQQNLPGGAQWVRVLCTAVSTTQAQVIAYNTFSGSLNLLGALSVAWVALQRD